MTTGGDNDVYTTEGCIYHFAKITEDNDDVSVPVEENYEVYKMCKILPRSRKMMTMFS